MTLWSGSSTHSGWSAACLLAAAFLLLPCCIYLPSLGRQVNEQDVASIHAGMSREETERLFGRPEILSEKKFAVYEGSRDRGGFIFGLPVDLGGEEFRILFVFNESGEVTRHAIEAGRRIAKILPYYDVVHPEGVGWSGGSPPARRQLFRPGEDAPVALALSPDEASVAVADSKGIVRIIRIATGEELLKVESAPCSRMAFSPDGRSLLLLGEDHSVRVLDAAIGAQRLDFKERPRPAWWRRIEWGGGVSCFAISPDGAEVASAGHAGRVKIWSLSTGAERRSFRAHDREVTDIAYSPDGRQIATVAGNSDVRIWDAATGLRTSEIPRKGRKRDDVYWGAMLSYSPKGNALAVATLGYVEVWRLDGDAVLEDVLLLPVLLRDHPSLFALRMRVHFSPDGGMIAGGNGSWIVHDLVSGRRLWRTPRGDVADLMFLGNGGAFVTAGAEGVFLVGPLGSEAPHDPRQEGTQ